MARVTRPCRPLICPRLHEHSGERDDDGRDARLQQERRRLLADARRCGASSARRVVFDVIQRVPRVRDVAKPLIAVLVEATLAAAAAGSVGVAAGNADQSGSRSRITAIVSGDGCAREHIRPESIS